MGEVVTLEVETTLDLSPDRVLEGALGNLNSVIIFGFDTNDEAYIATSYGDVPAMLWLLELCKKRILEQSDDA